MKDNFENRTRLFADLFRVSESNIFEGLFRENEIRTNGIASYTVLITGLFFIVLSHLDKVGAYNLGLELCRWFLFASGIINIAIFLVARYTKFKPTWLKRLILAGIMISGAVVFYFYPLNSNFITYGPIIISAMYYDRKTIYRTTAYCWILFSVLLWGNVLSDRYLPAMKLLHEIQQITVWSLPGEVLSNYQIPHTVFFFITGIVCDGIARRGREFVEKQAKNTAEVSSMETELKTASGIQLSSMPADEYTSPDGSFSCSAYIRPAKQVGGDFYDYFLTGNDVVVLVGDVSDKGLSAAMFMMRAKNEIRAAVKNCRNLSEAVKIANNNLCQDNRDCIFVTLWIARINKHTGIGKCVNCGHMPPYLRHDDGSHSKIEYAPDIPLGLFEDRQFKSHPLVIKPQDDLFIFTDGYTDAVNSAGENFGMKRLEKAVSACSRQGNMCAVIAGDIESFARDVQQYDDMTALCFRLCKTDCCSEKTVLLDTEGEPVSELTIIANEMLAEKNCPENERRNIDVAVDEICDNIASYAYPQGGGRFSVKVSVGDNFAEFEFRDDGIPFNPLEAESPSISEEPVVGGLGIHIARNIVDLLDYSFADGHNCLRMLKIWD